MTPVDDTQSLRGTDQTLQQDYVSALQTLRRMRSFLLALLLIALILPLATFGLHSAELISVPDLGRDIPGNTAYRVVDLGHRFATFAAPMMTILLIGVYLLATNICLIGRLGSGRDAILALFWMFVLLLLLGQWPGGVPVADYPSVIYSTEMLINAESGTSWFEKSSYYFMFLLLPFLAMLCAIVADLRFGSCYRDAIQRVREIPNRTS
jgi:hypothetical protein